MAILHVSGMDCTLKTTICTKLSELLKCDVNHFDKPKNLEDGKEQYFNFLKEVDKDVICDRYHDGEHVYAPLYRGYESNYLKEFEKELRNVPYLFVNTTADVNVIIDRIKNRGEDFVKEEHYQTVLNLFDEYIKKQSMPYIKIDTSNPDLDDYMLRITKNFEIIKKMHNYFVKNNCKNIYYGNMEADNFIVVSPDIIDEVKDSLIKNSNYENSWITTSEDPEFVNYQIELLEPENIRFYGSGGIKHENI